MITGTGNPPLQELPCEAGADAGTDVATATRTLRRFRPVEARRRDVAASPPDILGESPAIQDLRALIDRVAPTDATVLITGETGTGKELVALAIHARSPRRERPFLAVNCGAISAHLLESELFGHEQGSFTGANHRHRGFVERAQGGHLLLDEVTEMPVDLQVKLLRILETGKFVRVGGETELTCEARVLACSNRTPETAVAEGRLRQDLLYRLNVFPIVLPPLRERGGDVILLARHFLAQLEAREGTTKPMTAAFLEALAGHSWPGNVRELKNLIHRAWILARDEIGIECFHTMPPADLAAVPIRGTAPLAAGDQGIPARIEIPLGWKLDDAERTIILTTLDQFGGHRRKTADSLGISPRTLSRKLAHYGLG